MFKLLIVAQQEMLYYLRQWTFYLGLLIMPLLFAAFGAIPRIQDATEEMPLPEVETILNTPSIELESRVGYVDHAGLIVDLPNFDAGELIEFSGVIAATEAMNQGEIESFYLITADYVQSGQVAQYSNNPQLLTDTDAAIQAVLRDNLSLTLENPDLAARLDAPVNFVRPGPAPPIFTFIPTDLQMSRLISAGLVMGLFVYTINIGGNLLLRALHREVQARVLEVMVVNTTPEQFIGGKLLGLTALTLGQAGLTLIAGLLVYGQNPDGSGPSALPLDILLLSLPFLLLGFLAYCGGIMAIAALWPDFRESGTLLSIMRLLTLSPLIGALFILPNPNGSIAIFLTLFPLTSHLLMPFRMLITPVSPWQWAAGILILTLWTAWWIWVSMRLFRVQGMLTGRSSHPKVLWQALWS